MVRRSYVGVAEQTAVEVGEEMWWKVELSLECVVSDRAMEVVFDSIFGCVSAA